MFNFPQRHEKFFGLYLKGPKCVFGGLCVPARVQLLIPFLNIWRHAFKSLLVEGSSSYMGVSVFLLLNPETAQVSTSCFILLLMFLVSLWMSDFAFLSCTVQFIIMHELIVNLKSSIGFAILSALGRLRLIILIIFFSLTNFLVLSTSSSRGPTCSLGSTLFLKFCTSILSTLS